MFPVHSEHVHVLYGCILRIVPVRCSRCAENLTPGELKKMKRKLLKAQKKAELERERQKQKAESERRDQSKRPSNDSEVDGLREEELFPEKLVAVSSSCQTVCRLALLPLIVCARESDIQLDGLVVGVTGVCVWW